MKPAIIVTVTVNPSLDKSTHFPELVPEQKLRCENPRYDAGGGGINVSKAIAKLGGHSTAIYTSGGPIGKMLENLLEKEKKVESRAIPTKNWTRENFIALDEKSNAQYRFGFPGESISLREQQQIKRSIKAANADFLVLSGSLNEGLSAAYYRQLIELAGKSKTKVILDTSGQALQKALEAGVYLVKPNIGELAKLVGVQKLNNKQVESAARELIIKGKAEIVVVSMGAKGAMLVANDFAGFVPAPKVEKKSTVGAGDSMVGGMVWALSQKKALPEVLRWGVACGSAATMNEGTQLFEAKEARRLFKSMGKNSAQ